MEISRKRGDTYADEFTITDKITWEPVNLAGCSFLLTVDSRQSPTDTTTRQYQIVGSVTDPTTGVVYCAPTAQQADRAGFFYFDLQMTDALGRVRTVASGTYIYLPDLTVVS